jgi:hypothetical protein
MTRALLVVFAVLLAVPAVASAKEITAVQFCGVAGCRTIEQPPQSFGSGGDGIPEPAPAAGPYYTVTLTAGHEGQTESWQIFYVPGEPMLSFRGERGEAIFDELFGNVAAMYRNLTRGLEPFPTPSITGATVDGQPVTDPQSYLGLYGREGDVGRYPAEPDFVPIVLHSSRPSPWTGARHLMFSPSTGALEAGTSIVDLPDGLAASIAARESLGPGAAAAAGSGGFDWPLVSIALTTAFALGLAALLAARRGRRPATL